MKLLPLGHLVWIATLLAVLFVVQAGCGSARRGVPTEEPLEISEEQVRRGQQVFMHTCNGCHPGGAAGLGPAINNKPLPDVAIRVQVRNGFGAMPAFSDDVISDEELDALLAYLNAL